MRLFPHLVLVFLGSPFVLCLADGEVHNLTHAHSSTCGGKEKASALLDVSMDCINKAKSLYQNSEDDQNCGQKEKSLAFLDVAMNVITEVKKGYPPCPECPVDRRPVDCSDVLRSGKKESGVYTIWPRTTNKSLAVYCDMDTDGGGWTVIQRRGNFSSPADYFYKDWESYKNGFGNLKEEFWIGNDNIHAISNQAFLNKPYKIRFDLKDASGKTGYAEYSSFWIEDEALNYTLHIEGYKGNIRDSIAGSNEMKFSTKDRKNDKRSANSANCAVERQGAWWYDNCANANLNGLYQPGIVSAKSCSWYYWASTFKGLSGSEIKLRS